MVDQSSDAEDAERDIIESMNKAFDNGNFYGLEYVLDELVSKKTEPANPNKIDWFGDYDYFA